MSLSYFKAQCALTISMRMRNISYDRNWYTAHARSPKIPATFFKYEKGIICLNLIYLKERRL